MQGDFSRLTFDPARRYSRVWMQQGRVQLDADWNELVEMLNHRLETECRDRVGTCAVPKDNPGFGIRIRKGLKFDGHDDFVWVGETTAFSFAGFHPLTIAAWVSPDIQGSGGTIVSKFNPHEATLSGEYCLSVQPDRTILFQRVELKPAHHLLERVETVLTATASIDDCIDAIAVLQAEQAWEPVLRQVSTTRSLPEGQFSHVAVVVDRREIKLYINGQLAALSPSGLPGAHSHAPFLIGAMFHHHAPTHSFNGVIDEVQVWRSARTQPQLQDDLQRTLPAPRNGLVSHWHFTEGAGNQIEDWSGNGHTGWRDGDRETCRPEWVPADVWISRGRCYVEGILCETEADMRLTEQPYLANSLPHLTDLQTGSYLLYLDVWQRFISAIEDPIIREVALGGIDTTARSQTIWQLKSLPLSHTDPIIREQAQLLLEATLPPLDQRGKLKVRQTSAESLPDNRLYRVEIHSSGGAYGDRAPNRWQSACAVRVVAQGQIEVTEGWTIGQEWAIGQCVELVQADADGSAPGILAQIVQSDHATHQLTLDTFPTDWAVDTHGKLRAIAAFKWSRDNGALVFAIDRLEQSSVILQDVRQISSILKAGNWVEIVDDDTVLGGLASSLCQIDAVEPSNTPIVHLKQPPIASVGQNPAKHPLLRCWDQIQLVKMGVIPVQLQSTDATDGGSTADAIALENGIQIAFEGSYFQQGDFWWLPARMPIEGGAAQGIAWSYDANGQPLARSPHGTTHYYTPVATLHLRDGKPHIHDLRQFFAPQSTAAVSKTGDTMSGSLTIEASLQVRGDVSLEGNVEVGTLYGELAANLVGTPQLLNQSVTRDKLAEEVGTIPPGVFILGGTPEPPYGYVGTGLTLHLPPSQSPWQTDSTRLPQSGRLTAVVIQNQIFAIYESGELWSYDPLPRLGVHAWVQHPSLPQPHRVAFGVAVLDSHLYIVGGLDADGTRSGRVDRYNPKEGEWRAVPPMPTPRSHLGAAAIGHHLHAIGGLVETSFPLAKDRAVNVHEVYNPAAQTWVQQRSLPGSRYGFGVGVAKGRLYAIAGKRKWFFNVWGKVRSDRLQVYSPATDTWLSKPSLPIAKSHLTVAVMGDKLYVTGGNCQMGTSAGIDSYDPATEVWSEAFQMDVARQSHGAVSINGRLYVLGGYAPSGAIDTLEEGLILSILYLHQKSG